MSKLSKTKGKSNELKQVHHVLRVCDFWSWHMLLPYASVIFYGFSSLLFSTSHKTQAIYLPHPQISWILYCISWYLVKHIVKHISQESPTSRRTVTRCHKMPRPRPPRRRSVWVPSSTTFTPDRSDRSDSRKESTPKKKTAPDHRLSHA